MHTAQTASKIWQDKNERNKEATNTFRICNQKPASDLLCYTVRLLYCTVRLLCYSCAILVYYTHDNIIAERAGGCATLLRVQVQASLACVDSIYSILQRHAWSVPQDNARQCKATKYPPSSELEPRFQRRHGPCNPKAAPRSPPHRPTDVQPSPIRSPLGHRYRLLLPRKLLPAPPLDRSVQLHSPPASRPTKRAACCDGRRQSRATARHHMITVRNWLVE